MFNKKLIKTMGSCLLLLILCFGLVSCVTAADLGNGTDTKKNINITIGPKTPGGLNTAINNAENNATIYLKNGEYTGTDNRGITINKNINIVGLGSNVTINAQRENLIFLITNGTVTLKKLKLINGYTTESGGAIYCENATLSVSNCIFTNNKAQGSYNGGYAGGGAIFSQGKTTINKCTFTKNQANTGGAINSNGHPLIVSNSIFTGNKAEYSGAIEHYENSLTVKNCTFTNNKAKGFGAIFSNGDATIDKSTFTKNQATGHDSGAIGCYGDSNTITKCTFKNNKAKIDGGAICFYYGTSTINNCTFKNNQAGYDGGAIISRNSTINNCTFKNNKAGRDGGAIDSDFLTVNKCTFINNQAKSNGGAIYDYGHLIIEKSTFEKNKANKIGGAIYEYGADYGYYPGYSDEIIIGSSFKLSNSKFKNNIAGKKYNAIYSKVTITRKNITITPKGGITVET